MKNNNIILLKMLNFFHKTDAIKPQMTEERRSNNKIGLESFFGIKETCEMPAVYLANAQKAKNVCLLLFNRVHQVAN